MGTSPANLGDESTGASKSTILVSAWALLAAFWSIFTVPYKTFVARTLIFQPLWLVRIATGDSTWVQDLGLVLSLHSVYSLRRRLWSLFTWDDLKWLNIYDESFRVYIQVFALLGGCGILAGLGVHRGHQLRVKEEQTGRFREQPIEESLLPPLLITSRTSHSRFFPEKHAFSYSYLFAGVPVGFQGRVGEILSVDHIRPAWFDVRSRDYLKRGDDHFSLGEKLKRYLHSQGVTDRDYSFAYLVTAPRVLGYSFNPVSFWYIYDSDTRLKYMILEVNNTFDERRMYLLKTDIAKEETNSEHGNPDGKTLVFTHSWSKDFHVSPFNSRNGSYSLRAVDPLSAFQETGNVKIDNTIVLRSSKEQPKIVARVSSEGIPKDPSQVTVFQLTKFLAAWSWVGFLTVPRIIWEAQKLFFQRKLHVWNRPEITESSIGRTYSTDEENLEDFFRTFLTESVERANKPLRVIYEPAHHDGEEIVLYSPNFTYQEAHDRTLTIKVISPAFYSRFIHYAHAKEAFDRECLTTDDKNRTLVLDGAASLPALLDAFKETNQVLKRQARRLGPMNRLRWGLLRRLRCPPAVASYPTGSKKLDAEYSVQDIRSFQFSELDRYVQQVRDDADTYRRTVVKLFVAERILFGLPALVVVADWAVRVVSILIAMECANSAGALDILRPRSFVSADLVNTGVMILLANAVHFWSFQKG